MKRHETILKYIGDGEYTADMEENAEGGWVLADEAQRLLTEARARIAELVSEAESQRKRANEAEARARPALTEEDRTVLAGLHTDLDDELACVPDDSTRGRWLARHIAVLDRLLAAPAPSHQACEGVHASAPAGMSCADCTIDGEPCPDCYAAAWRKRHPNVIGARPAPRAVTSEQVEQWADALIGQDAFGADEQVRVMLRDLGIEAPPRPVGKRYCAQCWLNGSGRFEMTDSDVCPNPSCVMNAHRSRAITPADGGDRG